MSKNTIKFGKIIETKMLCYAYPDKNEESGFRLELVNPIHKYWISDENVCIDTVIVQYKPPEDMDYAMFVKKAVETLRDKQKQIMAEAHKNIAELDVQIQSLLMLPYLKAEEDRTIEPDILEEERIEPSFDENELTEAEILF